MKKILLIFAVLLCLMVIINIKGEDYYVVPKDSIRFRIIPNSNNLEDIYMKEKVKEEINSYISDITNVETIDESRTKIKENIPLITNQIQTLFDKNNYDKTFNINYGYNYFPEKIYKGVKYEEGNYESMVIEIGNKSGDNYWCVLFPPLCLIDAEESDEVEYKFFISELIKKYITKE